MAPQNIQFLIWENFRCCFFMSKDFADVINGQEMGRLFLDLEWALNLNVGEGTHRVWLEDEMAMWELKGWVWPQAKGCQQPDILERIKPPEPPEEVKLAQHHDIETHF